MKKILLLISFSTTWNFLIAQQTNFFIQPEITVGKILNHTQLESSGNTGYLSEHGFDNKFDNTDWSYGFGVKSGINLNNLALLYVGIRYRKVIDESIYYCHICDLIFTGSTLLKTDFLEIPLGFRFNILKNRRLQPYISSEVFWAKALNRKDLDIIGIPYVKNLDLFRIAYKVGAAYKIGKLRNWEISLQSGLNTNLGKQKSYPRYHFREVTAEVGILREF